MLAPLLLLLTSFSPAVVGLATVDPNTPLLGICFMYKTAFRDDGPLPENADLSKTFCQLVKANYEATDCGDNPLDSFTGKEFLDHYSEEQAQFCSTNAELIASVLDGSGNNPEAKYILETSMAESIYMLESASEQRQQLFFTQNSFDWLIPVFIVLASVLVAAMIFLIFAAVGRRRALSSVTNNMVLLDSSDILTECEQGLDSLICHLPTNDFAQFFTTGICATTTGMNCIFNQEQILALAGPLVGGN